MVTVQSVPDYNSVYLAKWNSNKVNGTPIYISNFDTGEDYMPAELQGYENEINPLLIQAMTQWNNNYSLQIAIDENENNILFWFC